MTASIKWRMRELLASYGIQVSLTPTNPHLEDFLISRRIDTVLDVGANIGQFAQRIRSHGYDGRIISFEPVSSVYETLINAARSDPLWETRQLALGDCSGSKLINISKSTVYSSFVPQTSLATQLDPNAVTVRAESISIVPLDKIFADLSPGRTFLKIDTQGFEQAVIEGATKSLKDILGIQLELPIEHLYSNTWTIEEAIKLMRDRGFILAQTTAVNIRYDDPQSALELDCIFRRERPPAP